MAGINIFSPLTMVNAPGHSHLSVQPMSGYSAIRTYKIKLLLHFSGSSQYPSPSVMEYCWRDRMAVNIGEVFYCYAIVLAVCFRPFGEIIILLLVIM